MSRFANPSLRKTRTKNFGLIGRSFLCRTRPRIYFTSNKSATFLTAANTKKRLKFQPLIKPSSGKRGIRTPGTLQFNGFQDRRNRPLCHLSEDKSNTDFRYCQILAALNSPAFRPGTAANGRQAGAPRSVRTTNPPGAAL